MIPSCPRSAPSRWASKRSNWTSCWQRADFITLHVPLTDKTRNILSARDARQDEEGRADHQLRARRAGRRGGAGRRAEIRPCRGRGALTCSRWNRPRKTRCSACPTSSCTPHLGAATTEAQENVALAGGRTDGGLPADGGGAERAEHAVGHRRRGASHGPLAQACRAIWAALSGR